MDDIKSALILQKLVFDKIMFERKGFKTTNDVEFQIEVKIGKASDADNVYKVTLLLRGIKEDEYELNISLTGFFEINRSEEMTPELEETLVNKNSVAIMMPYLRSELSLLTAQPETDCVVLPPFNINKMRTE